MNKQDQLNEYFADGGGDKVIESFDVLEVHSHYPAIDAVEAENLRISFTDDSVSDWQVRYDEDGSVVDATCYNDVM